MAGTKQKSVSITAFTSLEHFEAGVSSESLTIVASEPSQKNESAGSGDSPANACKRNTWYEVFGLAGCQLDCQKIHQHNLNRRTLRRDGGLGLVVLESHFKWFTMSELEASGRNGCGSCMAHKFILETLVGPRIRHDAEYKVLWWFEYHVRAPGAPERDVQKIPLFHPHNVAPTFEEVIQSRFLPGDHCSPISMAWLRKTLSACEGSHQSTCPSNRDVELPTRLVDVTEILKEGEARPGVKLIESSPGQRGIYACLSHCWGSAPILCCTTKDTIKDRRSFISFSSLPRTFQDAVTITRELGLQYIWIDSLCIIQDDAGDWEVESAKMAHIYQNGYLTFAAASSSGSTEGFLSATPSDVCFAIHTGDEAPYVIGARLLDSTIKWNNKMVNQRFPLLSRGWVFQERLISPRLVDFRYGELSVSCLAKSECQCGAEPGDAIKTNASIPPHHGFGNYSPNESYRQLMATASGQRSAQSLKSPGSLGSLSSLDIWSAWRGMVQDFMSLDLKYRSDVLPALSGCARIVQRLTGGTYLAGMWREELHKDLVWNRLLFRGPSIAHPEHVYTAPSWSWASLPPGAGVRFRAGGPRPNWEPTNFLRDAVRDARCQVRGRNDLGTVASGRLSLSAELLPCVLRYVHGTREHLEAAGHGSVRHGLHAVLKTPIDAPPACTSWPPLGPEKQFLEVWPDMDLKASDREVTYTAACGHCTFRDVWLLRMERSFNKHGGYFPQEIGRECDDFLMVVQRAAEPGVPGAFRRIGLAQLHILTQEDARSISDAWFDKVWAPHALPKALITLV